MSEVERIVDQMKRGYEGDAWHGPSVAEVLDGVDAKAAAARPMPAAHSIWEIVLHLTATQELILARTRGESMTLTPEMDWPEVPRPTDQAWAKAMKKLESNDEKLRRRVAAFADEKLEQPLVAGGSSAYLNFHGYVQHNLYHAGQIAILKKQLD